MKKLFLLFILSPFLSTAQADTNLSENGSITSINEKGINDLVSKYERSLRAKDGVNGWRVQIAFKTKKEELKRLKIAFIKLYPEIPVYLEYEAPYYRIRIGNFRSKLEAIRIKDLISKHFSGAYPVPTIINFSKLGN
jgi:hypothetical protein